MTLPEAIRARLAFDERNVQSKDKYAVKSEYGL